MPAANEALFYSCVALVVGRNLRENSNAVALLTGHGVDEKGALFVVSNSCPLIFVFMRYGQCGPISALFSHKYASPGWAT